jgi:hypothetical protein
MPKQHSALPHVKHPDKHAFYPSLARIFSLEPDGQVYLNRALANWHRNIARKPYTPELIRILGEPIAQGQMWNPDAVLRIIGMVLQWQGFIENRILEE